MSSEERDFVARRQYDKIIEEQKKVDEQIGKQVCYLEFYLICYKQIIQDKTWVRLI